MKNRKKRAQREEVRKILHTMRLELAAQRLAQQNKPQQPLQHVGDLMTQARRRVDGLAGLV
jgi:hypothetical protein